MVHLIELDILEIKEYFKDIWEWLLFNLKTENKIIVQWREYSGYLVNKPYT